MRCFGFSDEEGFWKERSWVGKKRQQIGSERPNLVIASEARQSACELPQPKQVTAQRCLAVLFGLPRRTCGAPRNDGTFRNHIK